MAEPWRRKVESQSPYWLQQSVDRLEEQRAQSIAANEKRQREEPQETPGASSSSGMQTSLPSLEEDMKRFRHASMTPASFAPARHLYMCCGRPIVVLWMMSSRGSTGPVGPMGVVEYALYEKRKGSRLWVMHGCFVFAPMQHPEPTACCFISRIFNDPHGACRLC